MKPARIIPLLLFALFLTAPRIASAQHDTLKIAVDCYSPDPGFDFSFYNGQQYFVNGILLFIPPSDSVGFEGADFNSSNIGLWNYSIDSLGDSLLYTGLNGGGINPRTKDTGFYFELGGLGFTPFMLDKYDQPVTIEVQALSGNQVDTTFYITLIPTSFQGECQYDTVTGTGSTPVCDPIFNFDVYDKNGVRSPIDEVSFELANYASGSMRAADMQAPQGWTLNYVREDTVDFITTCGGQYEIPAGGNLGGFGVGLSADPNTTDFGFIWRAFSCGSLIDRDTISKIVAVPKPCSNIPSPDSLLIVDLSGCNFLFQVKNDHNGSGADTVSPISKYTMTIISPPNVTWTTPIFNPPQATPGTWQYSGAGTPTLSYTLAPKYLNMFQFAQPGGTTWTPSAALDDPDTGQNVIVQWTDSLGSTLLSSGIDTIYGGCSQGLADTAWVDTVGSCTYKLIVWNHHTKKTSSINAISMSVTGSGGSFPSASCVKSSNGWTCSAPGTSARATNISGASGYLATGSYDTITFCFDPAHADSSWNLTWQTFDSSNRVLYSNTIVVRGCNPPLECDSIHHSVDTNFCSDTISILNQREAGSVIDSFVVAATGAWKIDSANKITPWQATFAPGQGSVTFSGGTISPQTTRNFVLFYNTGGAKSSGVEVTTYANGIACPNTQTLICSSLGVSSPEEPSQTLSVSVVPNPMNQQAEITLTTGTISRVKMTLLDVLGRTATTILNGTVTAGDHGYTLDVSTLQPGTYYLRIEGSGATLTKKLVVEH